MGDFFGISGGAGATQTDLLIESFRRTRQPRIDALTSRKTDLERKQSFFNTLNSRVNSLLGVIDKFTASNALDNFLSKKINSSDNEVVTASADKDAFLGNTTVKVNRLAQSDILITKRLDLNSEFGKTGTMNFTIGAGENTFDVSVEFDGTETNEQAMKKIVNAVNDVEDITINASFVKDTSSTGRISFVSQETGSENQITLSGDSGLNKLGISPSQLQGSSNNKDDDEDDDDDNNGNSGVTSRKLQSGSEAGYKVANSNDLDANLTLNGIEITRSSNSIDDLMEGVTLNLVKEQTEEEQAVTLTTDIDTDSVKDFINDLLKSFNTLMQHVSNKTMRRADSAVSSLQQRLRGIVSETISGLADESPQFIQAIGIEIESDGTLKLNDTEKLQEFLDKDPEGVANLFISEDGFVAKLQNAIANLEGDDGLIKARTNSFIEQIDRTEKRIADVESVIDSEAAALRDEYNSYLQVLFEAEGQFNLLQSMPTGGLSGGFNSLLASSF